MSPISHRDSECFNLEVSNIKSIVNKFGSNRKSVNRSLRWPTGNSKIISQSMLRDRHTIDITSIDAKSTIRKDNNLSACKKRQQIRENIRELASRKKGTIYSDEMALMPISPYNKQCDPDLYFKEPFGRSKITESACLESIQINSPIEALNILHDCSKQVGRFNDKDNKSDSRRSFKIEESWELHRDVPQLHEAERKAIEDERESKIPFANHETKKRVLKAKTSVKNSQINQMCIGKKTIEESANRYPTKTKSINYNKNRKIIEEPCDEPVEYYDNYGNNQINSLIAINKNTLQKFKPAPEVSPKILDDLKSISERYSFNGVSKNHDTTVNEVVKKVAIPFTDKTNQQNAKRKRNVVSNISTNDKSTGRLIRA